MTNRVMANDPNDTADFIPPRAAEPTVLRPAVERTLVDLAALTHPVRLGDGDQVLLYSDGLTDMVDDMSIGQILRVAGTSKEACQALVDLALANGSKDNVNVVLTRYRFVRENG